FQTVHVSLIDHSILTGALASPITDYEDAVQHGAAIAGQLDAIVTRNLKDYKNATLPVFSPTDFLSQLTPPE
ncbi:MAG TPA: PIN domain-containing protein, partial [Pyrinomonadaceae bacterium]|nr:PIN domain-containing protein [Pyrinomonadaceae bacterium]